jgi:glutathione-regulated potassium-efflux system ancillary protein KefC/glutathione-regulated potassium-efflux system protein KefB
MAMGAFLAGVLLADSEFRHALQADIEPFKGLLLGLFFMAVGMSVNLGLVAERPVQVAALTVGLVALKFAVLFAVGTASGLARASAARLAAAIAQGGEFAFVILTVAVGHRVVPAAVADLLILVVTLSMALTPALFAVVELVLRRAPRPEERRFDTPDPDQTPRVIIAGFGRFGQIVGRILRARNIPFTALDASPEQVDFVRRYGNKTYYGDASSLELLHAAQADRADVFVLAIDDMVASLATARVVREHFPRLAIYARARNRKHAYQLMDLGVRIIRRETFASSLELAEQVLRGLGLPAGEAARLVRTFREHDVKRLHDSHASHDDEARMRYLAMESARELEALFAEDAAHEELVS